MAGRISSNTTRGYEYLGSRLGGLLYLSKVLYYGTYWVCTYLIKVALGILVAPRRIVYWQRYPVPGDVT